MRLFAVGRAFLFAGCFYRYGLKLSSGCTVLCLLPDQAYQAQPMDNVVLSRSYGLGNHVDLARMDKLVAAHRHRQRGDRLLAEKNQTHTQVGPDLFPALASIRVNRRLLPRHSRRKPVNTFQPDRPGQIRL